jgi:polysaccharide biosynthesis protein PslG
VETSLQVEHHGRRLRSPLHLALLLITLLAGSPSRPAIADSGFVYGMNIAGVAPWTLDLALQAGFPVVKVSMRWEQLQRVPGKFTWWTDDENDLNNILRDMRRTGVKVVLRVDGGPPWAGRNASKANAEDVYKLYYNLAAYVQDLGVAYEVLNEPNLRSEWGAAPDPGGYTRYLKAAYAGVKTIYPSSLVLSGGFSPATGSGADTLEDFDFIRGMYGAGAKGSLDALAIHNYGGGSPPEQDPFDCSELCFRRAERYKALLEELGDAGLPIWSTEFGWPIDGGYNLGAFDWMKVSREQQADYLVRSHQYARANWPWMHGMLLFNLDHSTAPWYGPDDPMSWFSIVDAGHAPRPAYEALKKMDKP